MKRKHKYICIKYKRCKQIGTDYQKLMKCIVKTIRKPKSNKYKLPKQDISNTKNIFKTMAILLSKKPLKTDFVWTWLSMSNSLIFSLMGMLSIIGIIFFILASLGICMDSSIGLVKKVFNIIFFIMTIFTLLIVIAISKRAAKEIDEEKDKNFQVTLFSGLICFLALMISIISLYISLK